MPFGIHPLYQSPTVLTRTVKPPYPRVLMCRLPAPVKLGSWVRQRPPSIFAAVLTTVEA